MRLPTITRYLETVADPEGLFATLRHFEIPRDPYGRVRFIAGNNAVVFRMRIDGRDYILKCFIRSVAHREAKAEYVAKHHSPLMGDGIRYLPNEIFVYDHLGEGHYYNVVIREWIEGNTLDKEVRRAAADRDGKKLEALASAFDRIAAELLDEEWAHGDLKPDNIIVGRDGRLHLIDLDAIYIPTLAGEQTTEIGTPPYQHPGRDASFYDKHIDDYSIAIISTSLHYLAGHPGVYDRHSNGENLILHPAEILSGTSQLYNAILDQWAVTGFHDRYALALALRSSSPRNPALRGTLARICGTAAAHDAPELTTEGGLWGYDAGGQEVVAHIYEDALPFSEGLAAVKLRGGWYYIDTSGDVVLSCPDAGAVSAMSEGVAAVCAGGKWGYLDREGRWMASPQFEVACGMHEGLAAVKTEGKYGYIGRDGQWAVTPRFDYAGNFRDGRAEVESQGDAWPIDSTGERIR